MRFGGLTAVNDVSLTVHEGEIVGLIGPNGAGKTTFFNCLTGMYMPTEGGVTLHGTVLPPKPLKVVRAGMARTFQNIRLFGNMTALENVMVGRYCRTSSMALTSILRGPKFKREEAATRERAQELLDYVGLGQVDRAARPQHAVRRPAPARDRAGARHRPAGPAARRAHRGHEPAGRPRQAMDLIFKIRDGGLAVVVIEHDMRFIFNLCDRVLCLVRGEMLVEGTPGEVQSDQRVIEAYIGGDDEEERRVSAMLEVKDLEVAYGKIEAVKGISFDVNEGEVVTLIGTNGAGKTTTLRTISGLLRPTSGSITFKGKDITTVAAHDIVQLGLAHSPEGRRIFPRLTVEENLVPRRVRPQGQGADPDGPRVGVRPLPHPARAAEAAGRHVLRR